MKEETLFKCTDCGEILKRSETIKQSRLPEGYRTWHRLCISCLGICERIRKGDTHDTRRICTATTRR